MKNFFFILICFVSFSGLSQNEFPKDTIDTFSLTLKREIYIPVGTMLTTMDNNGNIQFTYYISNFEKQKRDTIAHKQIKLDFNTFRQLKEQISEIEFDTINSEKDAENVSDGSSYYLTLNLNKTKLILSGQNRDYADKGFSKLIKLLKNYVGEFAYDYEYY